MTDYLTGQRFEVSVELDKPRMLKIDFNAMCKAEEVSGLSFLDWQGELTGVRLKALVWASLVYKPGEHQLSYEEVGDVLNSKVLDVISAIGEAWVLAMPELEESQVDGDQKEDPQESATTVS